MKMSFSLAKEQCFGLGYHSFRLRKIAARLSSDILFRARADRFLFICQFWRCGYAMKRMREYVARMIIGVHERNGGWSGRENMLDGKTVLLPYVPNSALTMLNKSASRMIPTITARTSMFYFSGHVRNDRVREELSLVNWTSLNGRYHLGESESAANYAAEMFNTRFCLHVRGDSPTSRRLFDAIAAGCIPIIIANHIDKHLPFPLDIPYEKFALRIDETLSGKGMEMNLRKVLNETSEKKLVEMQKVLLRVRQKIAFGFGDPFGKRVFGGLGRLIMEELRRTLMGENIGIGEIALPQYSGYSVLKRVSKKQLNRTDSSGMY
ncbi:exostosin family-domain-containing protein [Cladochytrium replicatum]|nr:exostosin family-domain-containing protein [Cladochytrium replicatum]